MPEKEFTDRDITGSDLYAYVRERFSRWYRPGSGAPCDLLDLSLSPDGTTIAGAGVLVEKLEGLPGQRICLINAADGGIEFVSSSERIDKLPRWSPDGSRLLFISDRDAPYDFQVEILEIASRTETPIRLKDLWVEAAHWSPDGRHVLIAAAGRGVDLAGAQGGTPSPLVAAEDAPGWAPEIKAGPAPSEWRTLWLYELETEALRRVSPDDATVWEACWCGNGAVLFVGSDGPSEEDWYGADPRILDLSSGVVRTIYKPEDQLGWPSASPSGDRIAIVEAVCSDRTIVAGNLLVGGPNGLSPIDTAEVDVTFTAWQGEDALLYAGHRGFQSVLALYYPDSGEHRLLWADDRRTFGDARFPCAAPGREPGRAAFLAEGHFQRPELFILDPNGGEQSVLTIGDDAAAERFEKLGTAYAERWAAADGREIHGWLLEPQRGRPNALVLDVHGGPVWLWRPRFVGRPGYAQLLVEQGYALFQPNPRGSSGRGQDYARQVFGDMGGADTYDYLTGIDSLVAKGIADPERLGVTGGSYGGFMSSWLITQDSRFAAAAPLAPVTDWVSEHLTSHIGHFCEMFLADTMTNPGGRYFSRSPVFLADRVSTPTLLICGAIDQNTPPGQALEFHKALRMNNKESVLLTYPGEGHGVRKMPATIDFGARMIAWFQAHMPPNSGAERG